jgi:L-arabinonolactonase
MTVELLVDARARLGECPLWCDRAGALFWTDIEGRTVSRWAEADRSVRTWALPDRVGSFALCTQPDHLLLGLAGGIALFNLDTGAMSPVVALDMPGPDVRINDGRCDAQGRFVFGLFNGAANNAAIGSFYRVTAKLEIERLALPQVCVANSIAFSPQGTLMYFTDSWSRQIRCVDYHADGRIGVPRTFVSVPEWQGFPDGSAVDSEGGLWTAQWEGGCVVRYDPSGAETKRIPLPASRPTCPSFGGRGLDRLFVTTARVGLDEAALRAQPTAGAVFATAAGWRGLPERRFVTDLRV